MAMCIHGQEFETCSFGCTYRKAEDLLLEINRLRNVEECLRLHIEKIKKSSYPGLAVKESTLLNRIYKMASQALKGE